MTHARLTLSARWGGRSEDGDEILVEQARADHRAFGTLYERHYPAVYRYLRARTPHPEDAADLTQQVFVLALRGLPQYRTGRAPFVAWLLRSARNVAIDAHRRRKSAVSLDAAMDLSDDHRLNPVEADVLRIESLAALRQLVEGLDDSKRELLALRFAAGLTSREIAPIVGKSEAAVKKQLTRILNELKEHYRVNPLDS